MKMLQLAVWLSACAICSSVSTSFALNETYTYTEVSEILITSLTETFNDTVAVTKELIESVSRGNEETVFILPTSAQSGNDSNLNSNVTVDNNRTGIVVNESSENDTFSDDDYLDQIREFIFPRTWTWVLIFFHSVVFVIGLVGNTLVCVSVYRNHTMRTVTNYFIVNLAVADFLVILFCLPPSVIWDVTMTWFFGIAMCKVVLYLQVTLRAFACTSSQTAPRMLRETWRNYYSYIGIGNTLKLYNYAENNMCHNNAMFMLVNTL